MSWAFFVTNAAQVIESLPKNRRRWWVRPVHFDREECGHYSNLFNYLVSDDNELFYDDYRMSVQQYNDLLALLEERLRKKSIRKPHSPNMRLALTILYLAQGDSVKGVARSFRIGVSTAHKIIVETCSVIWEVLQPFVLANQSADGWKLIADDFYEKWNFPNCVGAVDGKHITIQCPPKSGSLYYNYKKFFSIVLLASCDANYQFTWVDIGDFGSMSDAGVWAHSDFGRALEEGLIDLPSPQNLPNSNLTVPHFFVGDEAFPLKSYMMRPYPRRNPTDEQRIFNYRLSRARRTIENTFGIMASKWRILRRPMYCHPETAQVIVQALVFLHNFVIRKEGFGGRYCPPGFVDTEIDEVVVPGTWRQEANVSHIWELNRTGSSNPAQAIRDQRNMLCDYVNSEDGMVEWQWRYALGGFIEPQ